MRAIATIAVIALCCTFRIPDAGAAGGTQLWVARYDVARPSANDVAAVGVSPDGGRLFVTGFIAHPNGNNYRTVAYDASTGAELWTNGYGPGDSNDNATALGVSPDGSKVFVTGWSYRATTGADYVTIAYDAATGMRLWMRRYAYPAFPMQDRATALGVSPDGSTVFVTGTSDGAQALSDYATVAYDASTGHQVWTARFDDGDSRDSALALGVSPDGSAIFVTGYSARSGGTSLDFATIGYDASTGERLWRTRYDGHGLDDQANALGVSPDSAMVFVTGYSDGSNGARDFATVAYNASTGARSWVRRYDGPGERNDNAKAMGVSPDGSRVFVTGYRSGHQAARDLETIAYDASTGARLWLRSYNGPVDSDDQATALGVSPDGRSVFVTGFQSEATFFYDYVTVAYRAHTGTQRWLQVYDAADHEAADALGVSPDGSRVFVSGLSDYDFATVAYSAS